MSDPERDFDMDDVRHVAREGAVRRPPEYDIKQRSYSYMVEGADVDGRPLEIVFAVGHGFVKLITGRRP